jgi:dCTP deaminase
MRVLKDDELVPLVTGANPILTDHGYQDDWYARNSPIQPCSIDLTIGRIYLPGAKRDEDGGETAPTSSYHLKPGQTAIVATRETLHLRPNLAAFGFPPSSVSSQGLLITNPGHVDPGYVGQLRFTIINMSSQSYPLQRGREIVTLLVIELSGDSHRDWPSRGNQASPIGQANIDVLSSDFLDVERRAKEITDQAVTNATFRAVGISAIVPILVAIIGFSSVLFTPTWKTDLEKQMAAVKEWANVGQTQARVTKLEADLNAIKLAVCRQNPAAPYCQPEIPAAPDAARKMP